MAWLKHLIGGAPRVKEMHAEEHRRREVHECRERELERAREKSIRTAALQRRAIAKVDVLCRKVRDDV